MAPRIKRFLRPLGYPARVVRRAIARRGPLATCLREAEARLAAGDVAAAVDSLLAAPSLKPGDEWAIVEPARRLMALGRLDDVEAVLDTWPSNRRSFWVEWEAAKLARARESTEIALAIYEGMRDLKPDDQLGDAGVLECLMALERFDAAEAAARDALARHPQARWIWDWAAQISEARGEYGIALERWRALLALTPSDLRPQIGVTRALHELKGMGALGAVLGALEPKDTLAAVSDISFRCPNELRVTETPLRRVLVVGSCLAAGLPSVFKAYPPKCEADFILVNNLAVLPDTPPRPVADYDFQVLQIPLRAILPEGAHFALAYDRPEAYDALFEVCCGRISNFMAQYMKWNAEAGLLTFVFNFMQPQQNPLGRLLPRYDLRNFVYFIEKLNEFLSREAARYGNAYLVDLDQIVATFGRRYVQDDVMALTSHGAMLSDGEHEFDRDRLEPLAVSTSYYPSRGLTASRALWRELEAMFRTVRQIDSVKLVLIDLDDTLWRGVIAETGTTNIEGWPLGLAEALLFLKRRGVILGIVSKNSEARIEELWPQVFGDLLPLATFPLRRINWSPKSENIAEILADANLLPKSVVFIDDNPIERAAVKAAFPDMRVLGANPYLLRRILLWSAESQVAAITPEATRRGEMVNAQVEREQLRRAVTREDFLASLGVVVTVSTIASVDEPTFVRALELLNRTNQFNTTGRRWSVEEARAYFAGRGRFYTLNVRDRFTSYGLVGVICAKEEEIDQFVMSCRVVGLDVELAFVSAVLATLAGSGALRAKAAMVETPSNLLARDIWLRCGFSPTEDGRFERYLADGMAVPGHIRFGVLETEVGRSAA